MNRIRRRWAGTVLRTRLVLGLVTLTGLTMAAVGLVAAVRRVPLALWWTLGVVIGGVLGRWS